MSMKTACDENDEEFNNFMHRVTEVAAIVKKLSSKDDREAEIGSKEADRYLGRNSEKILANLSDTGDEIVLNVKSDRTIVNRAALKEPEVKNENEMSQEAFMREVSKDADMRYKDRLIRTEKMETFKKQATLAFRRGEYERAVSCYTKAIEQIKDSPLLYNNRCLSYLRLSLYERAESDAKTALKLNENCLKSYIFLMQVYHNLGKKEELKWAINEAKMRNPKQSDYIDDFLTKLEQNQDRLEATSN